MTTKKKKKKPGLRLKKQTLAKLSDEELEEAGGGLPPVGPPQGSTVYLCNRSYPAYCAPIGMNHNRTTIAI